MSVSNQMKKVLPLFQYVIFSILVGIVIGLLAGFASWAFLESLAHVTDFRINHSWLLFFLPLAAGVIAACFHYIGNDSHLGNGLLLDQIHTPSKWVPRRMAPFVFIGTVVTHLFGGSVGREGAAIQMSGSLTDGVARQFNVAPYYRRIMLVASLAGGFGAVFGVPLAGTVFAMEVQPIGRLRFRALLPSLVASFVGRGVVHFIGFEHTHYPHFHLIHDGGTYAKIAIIGLFCGLASTIFVELTHSISHLMKNYISYVPLRGVVGGCATIILAALFGHDYLGLSLGIVNNVFDGHGATIWVPILKIIFTTVALGCGFPGGEVTPLFVIGAALGSVFAAPFNLPILLCGAIGFVSVFAGAANTPATCSVMAAEIFGSTLFFPALLATVFSYILSNHRGIYAPSVNSHPSQQRKFDLVPKCVRWVRKEVEFPWKLPHNSH